MTEDREGLIDLKSLKHEADPDIEIQSLRRNEKKLKAEIRRMQADYGDLKGYFNDVTEAIKDSGIQVQQMPPVKPIKPTKSKVATPVTAVLHLTDWHYGACQDASEIEFVNSFSPEILESRINNLITDYAAWVDLHRAVYQINELVILDTGDNISGDIHDELRITNAYPTPVQAVKCGQFKGSVYSKLASHFDKVRVEFITADNHGRLTKKPQAKQEGLNNHNYTVGHVAKMVADQQENVTVNLHEVNEKSVNVGGRRYLICHGHGIMGWAGFPYYGIERKVAKEAQARMNGPDENKFDRVVMGHWHAPLTHPKYWIGGSASGTDSFDHKCGRRSLPIQCAWMVHPKKGEFDRTEFELHEG